MERTTSYQKIKLSEKDNLAIANRYYRILAAISNTKLTDREIQLLGFLAVKGNVSYSTSREEFCTLYNSSSQTMNNIIFNLKKLGLLIKDKGKIKINPQFSLDFNNNLSITINLLHG